MIAAHLLRAVCTHRAANALTLAAGAACRPSRARAWSATRARATIAGPVAGPHPLPGSPFPIGLIP
jgi:hypothetical protein